MYVIIFTRIIRINLQLKKLTISFVDGEVIARLPPFSVDIIEIW